MEKAKHSVFIKKIFQKISGLLCQWASGFFFWLDPILLGTLFVMVVSF
jgi:hypothetical protein